MIRTLRYLAIRRRCGLFAADSVVAIAVEIREHLRCSRKLRSRDESVAVADQHVNRDPAAGLQHPEGLCQDLVELPGRDRGVERPFEHDFVERRDTIRDAGRKWIRDAVLPDSL